ncbi:lysophospholipid acyltransferase family protein [Pseudomonas asuensis]|jgi:1-acyl-sn-glycerol-3-phosphate acyltransferase|uniref:Lysophosphatidic acid acyltransferase n=1 Tax=Pseudomonas asuensis TaxID=1825787 RepID=A0ABQ2GSH1_9PSED|nr:lysophospholipid acyltransferase family protein [Pseudomonas asuensis]GGM11120.1 lysophosphatidic acid acyltransferase [Pseudomonas asuensis]
MRGLRTVIFYILLGTSGIIWSCVSLLIAPLLSYRARYRFVVKAWTGFAVWLAKVICGIRYEISGLENVPKTPCIIIANHQSTWETFFLSALFEPTSQVIKRELLKVPFFGWAFALLKPIAIDRNNGKLALQQITEQGGRYIKQGCWVLIFPQGTRVSPGETGKFSRGGAALACALNVPVLPIAHNAGEYWPNKNWIKRPGTIKVIIGPVMSPHGSDPRAIVDLNTRSQSFIDQALASMSPVHNSALTDPPARPATDS